MRTENRSDQFRVHARVIRSASGASDAVERVPTEKGLPPLRVMARNFVSAAVREGVARFRGIPAPSDEAQAGRKAICEGDEARGIPRCEEYRPSDGRCALCGCWKDRKASWAKATCPKGKWEAV